MNLTLWTKSAIKFNAVINGWYFNNQLKKGEQAMIEINHTGTELSLAIGEQPDGLGLTVMINGSSEAKIIKIEGGSKIDLFIPSVQGTIIYCILESGEERFFDSITGSLLSRNEIIARKPTFYV
jgi:hypothetical protein